MKAEPGLAPKQHLFSIAAMLLAPLACLAQHADGNQISAAFDKEGRAVTLTAPGFSSFSFRFCASVEVGGSKQNLSSAAGAVQARNHATESTPYGKAAVATSTIHFDSEHLDLMLRLGEVPGIPGKLFQAGIRNAGG